MLSGRGTPWTLPLVVSPDYPGAAIVSGEDAASLGLALSEIPGEASLVEALTGRAVPHRRALCRVTFQGEALFAGGHVGQINHIKRQTGFGVAVALLPAWPLPYVT